MHNLHPERPADGCLICQGNTEYYFSKQHGVYSGSPFSGGFTADYWKCTDCGFVISKTHQRMAPSQWECLNASWHNGGYATSTVDSGSPPYADQALALVMLAKNTVIDTSSVLDYAAGYAHLASFLKKYFSVTIQAFDPFVQNKNIQYVDVADLQSYSLVINSAMFEHVLERASLDAVNSLVAEDGAMMLHTVVCENIPKDPDWFYMAPVVHTAFHTNASMNILMKQWGYAASVYAPQAKSWFLFKEKHPCLPQLQSLIKKINSEMHKELFYYKAGFVDYWKGF